MLSVATLEFNGILASAALPSCDGKAANTEPGSMYSESAISVPGTFLLESVARY
ncbi:unannotated protein [freshwater metagenome]|uniref:Unannotated protein n=1 Tax=freshwater metagenome TaxID=449393 RepID=A0A6J6T3M9_9ZZZZ